MRERVAARGHAVVVVAEGAGQPLLRRLAREAADAGDDAGGARFDKVMTIFVLHTHHLVWGGAADPIGSDRVCDVNGFPCFTTAHPIR